MFLNSNSCLHKLLPIKQNWDITCKLCHAKLLELVPVQTVDMVIRVRYIVVVFGLHLYDCVAPTASRAVSSEPSWLLQSMWVCGSPRRLELFSSTNVTLSQSSGGDKVRITWGVGLFIRVRHIPTPRGWGPELPIFQVRFFAYTLLSQKYQIWCGSTMGRVWYERFAQNLLMLWNVVNLEWWLEGIAATLMPRAE